MAGLVAAGSGQASRAFPESGVKPVLQVPQRRHVAASGPRSDPHTRVVGSRLTSVKPGPDQRLGILPLPRCLAELHGEDRAGGKNLWASFMGELPSLRSSAIPGAEPHFQEQDGAGQSPTTTRSARS